MLYSAVNKRKNAIPGSGDNAPINPLYLQPKQKIEHHLSLVNITNPNQPSQKSISFEQPLLVFLLQVEAIPSGGPDLGQAQPN